MLSMSGWMTSRRECGNGMLDTCGMVSLHTHLAVQDAVLGCCLERLADFFNNCVNSLEFDR